MWRRNGGGGSVEHWRGQAPPRSISFSEDSASFSCVKSSMNMHSQVNTWPEGAARGSESERRRTRESDGCGMFLESFLLTPWFYVFAMHLRLVLCFFFRRSDSIVVYASCYYYHWYVTCNWSIVRCPLSRLINSVRSGRYSGSGPLPLPLQCSILQIAYWNLAATIALHDRYSSPL